jgi:hypothetical protein
MEEEQRGEAEMRSKMREQFKVDVDREIKTAS